MMYHLDEKNLRNNKSLLYQKHAAMWHVIKNRIKRQTMFYIGFN
jgi:hypothetical protein